MRIFNEENDHGRVYVLKKRLHDIPTELNELFKEILIKDVKSLQELLLCI